MIAKAESLKISDEGIEAVFRLCAGDMRRVVNMLQVKLLLFSPCQ
jgi:DNA polymerase III delta prime subunit